MKKLQSTTLTWAALILAGGFGLALLRAATPAQLGEAQPSIPASAPASAPASVPGAEPDGVMNQVDEARRARDAGKAGYGLTMRSAASELFKAGRSDEALQVLAELESFPESNWERLDALRMQGQYLSAMAGRQRDAEAAFQSALRVADADPRLKKTSMNYASVAQQYANLLAMEGRTNEALAANSRVLAEGTLASDELLASVLGNNIGICQRAGRSAEAIEAIDRLFARFPEYGRHDGDAMTLRLVRADLVDPTRSSDAYVNAISALWADRTDCEQAANVGLILAQSHRMRREYALAIPLELDIVGVVERVMQAGGGNPQSVRTLYRTVLFQLSTADAMGRPDCAALALQRLRDSTTDAAERQGYVNQMSKLPAAVQR